ncbi:uncharacterized protein LOC129965347 isoform X2 [Argiope bruennichi]|uniref:uncharacterized protein LOC129965347 isoform X2 n=1 Tax=Argiope bruennichi TaxID=94029 RepID=UPI0024946D19|nr:uncharacterized protein LOC129965347 isoform X2 [Argiope bruennichi]
MSSQHRKNRSSRHHHEPIIENQDSNSNNSTGIINIITSKKQGINTFANDGSFLELFKKKMEEEAKGETSGTSDGEGNKSADEKLKKPESSIKANIHLLTFPLDVSVRLIKPDFEGVHLLWCIGFC